MEGSQLSNQWWERLSSRDPHCRRKNDSRLESRSHKNISNAPGFNSQMGPQEE